MIKHKFKFSNGELVKDLITDFEGVVTGSVYYITGCNQYLVTPKKIDKSFPDSQWLDEDRLFLVKKSITNIKNSDNGPGKQAPIK